MLERVQDPSLGAALAWRGDLLELAQRNRRGDDTADLAALDGVIVAGDVRIDNRDEVAAELGTLAAAISSDLLLVLHAYRRWREGCAEKLVGDFAFATWDSVNGRLFCARDRFGVRPFYYHLSPGLFAFASETRSLLALPSVPRRLNEAELGLRLVGAFEDQAATLFEGIRRLEPAHWMVVEAGSEQRRRYWALAEPEGPGSGPEEEHVARYRAALTAAVRGRLETPDRPGSFLSGGLDSSSISCIARDLLRGGAPLDCFSIFYDGDPAADEGRLIELVVAQGGVELHRIDPSPQSPLGEWFQSLLGPDAEPPLAADTHGWLGATAAAGAGVGMLLSGEGATTWFPTAWGTWPSWRVVAGGSGSCARAQPSPVTSGTRAPTGSGAGGSSPTPLGSFAPRGVRRVAARAWAGPAKPRCETVSLTG